MKKYTLKEITDLADEVIKERNNDRNYYFEDMKKSESINESNESIAYLRNLDTSYELGINHLLKSLTKESK